MVGAEIYATVGSEEKVRYLTNTLSLPVNRIFNSRDTSFVDGAGVTGFFVLEEADTVEVPMLGRTLCVLLSGPAAGYSDGATPVAHCKRDASGNILFKGDWCAETNMTATPACEDALRFSAQFAAVGAKIL